MKAQEFFEHIWQDYITIAPGAKILFDRLVVKEGTPPINDHVAFRTYDLSPVNLEVLEKHFFSLGYKRYESYEFKEKKLSAYSYTHPEGHPRIFLSQLKTAECSKRLQDIVKEICTSMDPTKPESIEVMWSGRFWNPIPYSVYQELVEESEYAAWVAALGIRVNHFTFSINHLQTIHGINDLADWIESQGYALNTSGGRIKGTPEIKLEQGSTMADEIQVDFAHGEKHPVRSCFYEFAQRHPVEDGTLFNGFVAGNANKIFESTNVKS